MAKKDVFIDALAETMEEQEELEKQGDKILSENDYLLAAFQYLIKADLARVGKTPEMPSNNPFLPPVFSLGK